MVVNNDSKQGKGSSKRKDKQNQKSGKVQELTTTVAMVEVKT